MNPGPTPDAGDGGGETDGAVQPTMAQRWIMATRPRTLPAAVAPVVLATAIAASRGVMAVLPAAAALTGALLIQAATNLANDYFDHVKGGDTEDRLGPTRVVQAGLLEPRAVLGAAIGVLALAVVVGAYLVWVGGIPVLVIGILAVVCALAYTGGPFPLAYHGLGDLFVFVFFGLVAVGGTYWVQAAALPLDLLWAGSGVGAVTTAILVVNNLRDLETDARAGKRTLAVRLGETGTRIEFVLLIVIAMCVPLVGVAFLAWPAWTLLAWLGTGPLLRAGEAVLTHQDARELNPALGWTARGVTWYAGLMATGFLIGGT